jgi:hypothetical protein
MKRKDSGQWDHTNAMGAMFSWFFYTMVSVCLMVFAVMLVGNWGLLVVPVGQAWFWWAMNEWMNEEVEW